MNSGACGRWLLLAATCFLAWCGLGFISPQRAPLADFDKRTKGLDPVQAVSPEQKESAKALELNPVKAHVDFDPLLGSPRLISSDAGFLTGAEGVGKAVSPATGAKVPAGVSHRPTRAFLLEHRVLFGFGPEAIDKARVSREFTTPHSGLKTVVWQQQLDRIPLFEAVLISHTTAKGELVNISSQFVPAPESAAAKGAPNRVAGEASPPVSAVQSLVLAVRTIGENLDEKMFRAGQDRQVGATAPERRQLFRSPGLKGDAEVKLVWLPMGKERLRLCWDVIFMSRARGEMFRVLIDAETGEPLLRRCLTSYLSDASFRVFTSDSPSPFSPGWDTPNNGQPPLVARSLVTLSALDTVASPNGWIDDGVNETRGNNVDAHTDRDDNDFADLPRPQGSPPRVFDFAMNLASQDPTNYSAAAVVQLFYWANWMHDRLYKLGFTEAAGNFQIDNFGHGGLGNDPVQADAQDGSGLNNANMSTPQDGSSPRLQMYIFDGMSPRRDGDFDAEIVLHEYTHGLSNRRVGGGVGISALQSAGMGEGWSDFYGLALLSEAGDDPNGCYAAGGYASYKIGGPNDIQNYYFGIRRYPYCTDMSKNPLTFGDIDPAQANYCSSGAPYHTGMFLNCSAAGADEVHNQGEVWCVTLWEARANLIAKHGWAVGNELILQLVTDGMNLSPPNPNFLQARDAIVQADQVYTGGANRNELWAAFAKRGMGFSATSPSSAVTAGVREAFDIPDDLRITPLDSVVSSGPVGGPFSVASQTYSLTNSGTNSFSWVANNTAPWLDVSPVSGNLSPGGLAADLSLTLNWQAGSLDAGIYPGVVWLTNLASGRRQSRSFILRVGQPDYYTEWFDDSTNDLAFSTLTFTPDGSTSFYQACREPAVSFPTSPAGGAQLALTDDSFAQVTLTGTNRVRLYGRSTNVFFIGSNGYLTLDSGDMTYTESFPFHFDQPRISALFHDLNPGAAGTISWKTLTNRVAVTYQNVPQYGATAPNSFQIEWFFDGRIRITWLTLNCRFSLVGLSRGQGVPAGFAESDLSSFGPCVTPLVLSCPPTASEGDGVLANAGQVRIPSALTNDLAVTLTSSKPAQVTVSPTVTILAGKTNAVFDITIVDDALLDGTRTCTISASATGFGNGTTNLTVYDNESASLQVVLPPAVTEGQGSVSGEVRISAPVDVDVAIRLSSSDTTELQVPLFATVPAGQTSVVFLASVVADSVLDGPQDVVVSALVENWVGGSAVTTVNDDLTLRVTLPSSAVEGDGLIPNAGRVQLSGAVASDLVVALYSSNLTELTVPATLTIPAGQSSGNFDLTILHNPQASGDLLVSVGAAAPGFLTGSGAIDVRDFESMPVLTVDDVAQFEGDVGITNASVNVWLSRVPTNMVSVAFATTNATAVAGTDYLTVSGLLTFGPGVVTQLVNVPILGNTLLQSNRTFYVRLSNQSNAALGRGLALGTIIDDDAIPGRLHHFAWSPISAIQQSGVPFAVEIQAQDSANNPATNFGGAATLSAASVAFSTNRILGVPAGNPTTGANDFTIGQSFTPYEDLLVTHVRHYFGTKVSIWTDAGTLVTSQNVNSVPGTWKETPLATPVKLTANTTYRVAAYTGGGNYYYGTGLGDTFPDGSINQAFFAVGDTFPNTTSGAQWVFVDLVYNIGSTHAVALNPSATASFAAGEWNGLATVLFPASNVVLLADDGSGHTGSSVGLNITPGLHHFSWGSIASPQFANIPFPVTISAVNESGGTLTNFGGSVNFAGLATALVTNKVTTTNTWNGSDYVFAFGEPDTATYGQTFRAPAQSILTGFTVYLSNMIASVDFKFYIMAWDGVKATGPILYQSQPATTRGRTVWSPFTFNTGSLALTPGASYVAFVSTTGLFDGDYNEACMGSVGDTYTNGFFVFFNNGSNFAVLTNSAWDTSLSGNDLAFTAIFAGQGGGPVAISPGSSSAFVNGLWDGNVSVLQAADDMFLVADNGLGQTGASGRFSVVAQNDLVLAMTSTPATLLSGQTWTNTITVLNTGPTTATGVFVTNTVPAGAAFVAATATRGDYSTIGNLVVFNVGSMGSNNTATFEVALQSVLAGTWTNQAAVRRGEPDAVIANNIRQTTVVVSTRIHHFVWDPISSPQVAGVAFPVRLSALDVSNNPATDFAGQVTLTGTTTIYNTNRILGNPAGSPTTGLSDFTIGHSFTPNTPITITHVRHYFGTKVSIWTDSGTLLVAQPVSSVQGTWTETPLATPVQLSANTIYRVAAYTGGGSYSYRTGMGTSFPNGTINQAFFSAGDAFPAASSGAQWAYVDLDYVIGSTQSVSITPAVSTAFAGAAWTGSMTVLNPASGVTLTADDGHGHQGTSVPLLVTPAPIVASGQALLTESCPPTNGNLDPGELVTVSLGLRNVTGNSLDNVVAALLPSAAIYEPSGPASFGSLAPGAAVSNTFSFRVLAPCGSALVANLQVQSGLQSLGMVPFAFPVGGPTFGESFDSVVAPDLPTGWSATASGVTPWRTTTSSRDSLPNAVFAADPGSTSDNLLISPTLSVQAANAQLTFRHSYNTEPCCDSGRLEISINGSGFTDILTAGGSFASGGYNAPIGWSGNSSGFITTVANLPPSATGQTVQFRWHLRSDSSVGSTGWYVDSIVMNDTPICSLCSPFLVQSAAPGQARFSLITLPAHIYYVEYSDSLIDANWILLRTITGDGTTVTVTDPASSAQRFYRVRAQ